MKAIPEIMYEIGRLRETTFRAAGEGTGKATDIDQYDPYYTQLFLWDQDAQRLVGAYRLGHTREILEKHGSQGMYSSSLFKIKKQHWENLSSGLEMGRSFIRQEYQRSPMCLPLLWHGICKYLIRYPEYHSLYGCVSICSEYQKSSVDLMIDYLKKFRPAPENVSEVKPRTKHRQRQRHLRTWLKDLDPSNMNPDQLSQMISMLEPDGKGIPVLLRHYLKAGSKILCFNVDPDFSDVVDALIIVNLYETDSKLIASFLKRSEAEKLVKPEGDEGRSLA
jgi:putative hemolysin